MIGDQQNSAARELLALLPASPDAYPQNVDLVRGLVLVVRLDARAYRAASFLDDRILGPATQGAWLPGPAATEAARQVASPRSLHFIFHTGHVGSTLVSRLLDETEAVLPLREPLPLRTIADAHDALGTPESLMSTPQFEALLDMTLRLWSRGYDSTRAVVVKATSSAGRLAGRLLLACPEARALYLNLRAEPYLATLLGGANSASDLRGHGPGRMRRLLARGEPPVSPLHSLSPGELAALGWLVESLSQRDALKNHPGRVMPLDFDEFMADVAGGMERVLAHFKLPIDAGFLSAIPRSPQLQRYSKAPEQPFDAEERMRRIAQSRRDNREEIAKGMAWLDRVARADAAMAAVHPGAAA
ncbi:MAG: hypothetical protein ACRETI_09145 [Steroidobacteraceae bacterium]